jgi:drug/metabolite transporter (DMT)-like permease
MLAILLGAILHATWNALLRSATDKLLDSVLVIALAGVLAGGLLPFVSFPATASWPYLIGSVLIHLAYFIFVALAYREAELSFAYPIMRGAAPAFSAVGAALLLNESPVLLGWAGVLLISFGIFILSFDSWRSGSLSRSSLFFALSNAGVIVMYTLVDGQGVRLSNHPISYIAWMFFLISIVIVLASFVMHRGLVVRSLRPSLVRSGVGAACVLGSYGIALWAMSRAPIALVAALRETSVVFAVLIGAYFLGERISPLRVLSVLMVTAGAVVIKVS